MNKLPNSSMTEKSYARAKKLGEKIGKRELKWCKANDVNPLAQNFEFHPDVWDDLRNEGWEPESEEWTIASLTATGIIYGPYGGMR